MSIGPYTPPKISVEYDFDADRYTLMATSHGRTSNAGERIFRSEPYPDIAFAHLTEASALRDAQTLREYLADCASGKRKEKVVEGRRGWWME